MALSDQLQAINQTAEALSSCERRRLFYLCEILDTDNSEACTKEMLKSKVLCHERGNLFLTELMLQLRRFDILRKVYQTSRDEVEKTLKHNQVLPRFSTLSREQMEKAKSFLDVIIELEKLDIVSPERVDCIEKCLRNIGRVDLAKKVTAYKMSAVTSEGHLSQQQRYTAHCPVPTPSSSLQQTRLAQPLHIATENIPLPVDREQNCQSQLDCYKFNTNPRGVCVIIDCVGNDGDMLEHTFKNLHFNVVLRKWLSADETILALKGILRQRENLEGDGFVCCIISRGTENNLLGTDSYAASLRLDFVRRLFTADACPMLAGKPKLFFIQRYNVPGDEDLETDGCDARSRCDIIPTDADVFWSHCWTDGRQLEQGHHRSIYLKALTDALHKGQTRKTHLVDAHTEVNGAIFEHNKRNPGAHYNLDLKHTLRKNLYLQ
ncbi:CASP8 and FADD-like apoptosis regulator isoform X2 [Perca flavescens]|uniref:CASP8 and FADD-like apoptosis regulator isoform X2 n=1 Tax=Perca flavescens TaxID=8167 RepID=UPI00106EECDF|nr:CASP8 and FADD-like apoptosis regulator isoform X2 [Perca flavescens]